MPVIFLACTLLFVTSCGIVPIRHVPKVTVSIAKMSDLHGSQPITIKAGESITDEESMGAVGVGKVVGKLSEWSDATVDTVRTNISARGATLNAGASKSLTIAVGRVRVTQLPVVAMPLCRVVLTATNPSGMDSTFEATGTSLAPLSAVDGAVANAIKKMLQDPTVDAYLRK